MKLALVVVVALGACGAAPPAATPVPPTPREPVKPPSLVFRQLHVGASRASRTTFELAFDGDRATLVEIEERAPDGSAWTRVSSRTYKGTRRGTELELATDDMQPLALHCEERGMGVAARGSVHADCTSTHELAHVDALVCTAAGQGGSDDADADADDRMVFAPPPGVEWFEAACGGTLRVPDP